MRAEVERIRPQLPESVRMTVATDDAIFIWSSIVEVLKTLLSSLITLFLTPVFSICWLVLPNRLTPSSNG